MARALTVQIVGDATGLKKAFDDAEGAGSKFGGVMKKIGLAVGAAMVGGAVVSVKAFADFDAAMTQSLAIMGDVSDTMRGKMSDAAREVGKTTSFSAKEAAESYFFLASAGLDAEASIAALPVVAKFAQAGMFDMARATDLATDAQSALGLASDDAQENLNNLTRVTDVLVKANTLANASVEQFSEALTQKAGAALRSLNVDMEVGVATLAVFADQGIKGSEAGTALNATLIGLTEGARKNAKAFEEFGVQVFDTEGNMNSMVDIVRNLEGALGDMSVEEQRAALAKMGFNRQALNGILALIGNSEALAEYERELQNAAGTVDEIAEKQLQTFWAQLGLLKDQVMDLAIGIGERLMPHLMRFVEFLQDKMPVVAEVFGAVFGAISALFGSVEQEVSDATDSWSRGIDNTVEVMDGWAARLEPGVAGGRGALGTIADFITGTLVPAFTRIREWWDRNWPRIKALLDAFKAKFDEVAAAIRGFIDNTLIPAFRRFRQAWDDEADEVAQTMLELREAFGEVADAIGGLMSELGAVWASVSSIWRDDNKTTEASVMGLALGVVRYLTDSINMFANFANAVTGAIRHIREVVLDPFITFVRNMGETIEQTIEEVIGWWRKLREDVPAALRDLPGLLFQLGKDMVQGLINGIVGMAGQVARALGNVVKGAVDSAKRALGISSPSKVFMSMGEDMMRGLQIGVDRHKVDALAGLTANVPRLSLPGPIRGGDGAAMGGVIELHVHSYLDGEEVAVNVTRHQANKEQMLWLQGGSGG